MPTLIGIPVPSVEQIVVGAELVLILYPVRSLVRRLDTDLRRERNRIIQHHVKSGHESRLKHCAEDGCPSLRSSGSSELEPKDYQPEIELDLL